MTGITSSSNTSPSDYRIVTVWLNRWSLEIEVGQSGAACIANPATARVEAIVLYTKHKRSIELRFRRPNCISHRKQLACTHLLDHQLRAIRTTRS